MGVEENSDEVHRLEFLYQSAARQSAEAGNRMIVRGSGRRRITTIQNSRHERQSKAAKNVSCV